MPSVHAGAKSKKCLNWRSEIRQKSFCTVALIFLDIYLRKTVLQKTELAVLYRFFRIQAKMWKASGKTGGERIWVVFEDLATKGTSGGVDRRINRKQLFFLALGAGPELAVLKQVAWPRKEIK